MSNYNFPVYPSIIQAIQSIIPGAICAVHNEDLNSIDWMMDDVEQPSISDIETKLNELKVEYSMKLLRYKRDLLLAEVDWVTIRSYNQGVAVPNEWVDYCQALRDLPANTEDPENPVWPTKPE